MAPAGGAGTEKEESIGTYKGMVKSYNAAKGFGFIVCDDLQKEGWEGDIYIHQKHARDLLFRQGDFVSFEAFVFQGRLQGKNLTKIDAPPPTGSDAVDSAPGGPGKGGEMWEPAGAWENGWEKGKGEAFHMAKGKFKEKGKGAVGINPMAMMMAMMGMGGKG